jgi:hypothetical protein
VAKETREPQGVSAEENDDELEDENGEHEDEHSHPHRGRADGSAQGRTKLWLAIGIGVVVVGLFVWKRGSNTDNGPPLPAVGSAVTGDLTLVTADRNELECAAAKGVQNYQCGFADEKQTRPVQENNKLRPFMTVDRHLYLIPGLFLDPAISQRYNAEPANRPRNELKRFTAKCMIKVVDQLDGVKLRWAPGGTWEPAKKFAVATVSDCKIDG